jgi:FkbM family methyltransferase
MSKSKHLFLGIVNTFLDLYALLFAKRVFASANRILFLAGARGLGVLNYKRAYLSGEKYFLKKFLSKYDSSQNVVIDVGANIGRFALYALNSTRFINVRSYEPNPHSCVVLKRNLTDERRHELVEMGLSNSISNSFIYDYAPGLGSSHSSLYSEVIEKIHNRHAAFSEPIHLTTLDSDLTGLRKNIITLKIDTEGHEKAVLEGSQYILESNPPLSILIEFNEMNAVSGTHFRDILKLIGPNYTPYRILPGGALLPLSNTPPILH